MTDQPEYQTGSIEIGGINYIRRTSDGAFIPLDDRNQDYQAYLAWVAAGGVATEYKPIETPTG